MSAKGFVTQSVTLHSRHADPTMIEQKLLFKKRAEELNRNMNSKSNFSTFLCVVLALISKMFINSKIYMYRGLRTWEMFHCTVANPPGVQGVGWGVGVAGV